MACVDAHHDILPVLFRPVQNGAAAVDGRVIRVLPGFVQADLGSIFQGNGRSGFGGRLFRLLLEMLIVLQGLPVSAPGVATLLKELQAQVALAADLLGEVRAPIGVSLAARRGNMFHAIRIGHIRIIEGVDVYGQPQGML